MSRLVISVIITTVNVTSNPRAWHQIIRTFTSTTLSPQQTLTTEAKILLNNIRVLCTRNNLKQAIILFYNTPLKHHSNQAYAILFHACAKYENLEQAQNLHKHMLTHYANHQTDPILTNHIINLYAKCGHLGFSRKLFDEMPQRNVVSWTILLSGYARQGNGDECFRVLNNMLKECFPNDYAFVSVLGCCGYQNGTLVHALALKIGWDASIYVGNSLITMYNRSCRDEGWQVFETMEFRDIVSWNSMIAGFQFRKLGVQAMELFVRMLGDGIGFDRATLLSVISALSKGFGDNVDVGLKCCFQLHCLCQKTGFASMTEVATALVKAHSDLGANGADCYKLFLDTSCRDIVAWTGIITAFAECEPEEALVLFRELQHEGLTPDWYTLSIVLKACAGLGTERNAMVVHAQLIQTGFEEDTVLGNALIHAYSRCGSVPFSRKVFNEMRFGDLVSWNSMLKAYGLHGQAKKALNLFSEMNIQPDSTTMVALLSACSHAGLVEEGMEIFYSMAEKFGVHPELDHYACAVDILGRAGHLVEAEKLINTMPMEPDYVVWSALLSSCRKHGETPLANLAAERMKELQPRNSLGYVQMSNIYCSRGSYNRAGLIWKEMKGSRVIKEPGLSWIEIGGRMHEFASGGRRHLEREVICTKLDALVVRLKEIGYVPETSAALHDIEEEHKEEQIYHHSEKLAVVYAAMNEEKLHSGGNVIRIMKNIRICVDCHNFMKLASHFLQKEIVVRDSNRFHHFKDRTCSCNDYW